MDIIFQSLKKVFPTQNIENLKNKRVAIIGLGGVGSFTLEMIARLGIGHLILMDLDDICSSNINRQLLATQQSIGNSKVEEAQKRLKIINPIVTTDLFHEFYSDKTYQLLFNAKPDLIIDCMDSLKDKCHLINQSLINRIPLIISGSTAGRKNIALIKCDDLNFTFNDSLLYRVRKKLRKDYHFHREKKKAYDVLCVFSQEQILSEELIIHAHANAHSVNGVDQAEVEAEILTENINTALPPSDHDFTSPKFSNCNGPLGVLPTITSTFGIWVAHYALMKLIENNNDHLNA